MEHASLAARAMYHRRALGADPVPDLHLSRAPVVLVAARVVPQIVTGRIGHRARREREVAAAAAVVPRRFSYLRSGDLLPLGRLDASREARKSIPTMHAHLHPKYARKW